MSRKRAIIIAGLGIAVGYLLRDQIKQKNQVTPGEALECAKQTFMQNGPINGSWIYMQPEKIEKNGLTYDVYRGGVTRTIDGESKQFDFYADAETGTIIDVKQ